MLIRDRPWTVAVLVTSIFCGAKSPPIKLAKRVAELPPLSALIRKMATNYFSSGSLASAYSVPAPAKVWYVNWSHR